VNSLLSGQAFTKQNLKGLFSLTKNQVKMIAVLLLVVVALIAQPYRMIYNPTESMAVGWYLANTNERDLHLGDVVIVDYSAPDWVRERKYPMPMEMKLVKRVRAVPGDTIVVEGYYIKRCEEFELKADCEVIAVTKDKDKQGRDLPKLSFPSVLGADQYFLATDHPWGLDSRYLGLFAMESVIGKAVKL